MIEEKGPGFLLFPTDCQDVMVKWISIVYFPMVLTYGSPLQPSHPVLVALQ